MKALQILCPDGIKESELSALEANLFALWRIVPAGKAVDWVEEGKMAFRDTHDEETGEVLYAPYRGRHIVDGFGNIICEFVHESNNAYLIAAAPRLLAALERCIDQIEQMRSLFDDEDGAIQAALDDANAAIAFAAGERKHEQDNVFLL